MEPKETYHNNERILSELHYEISEFLKIFSPVFGKHLIGERRQRSFCRLSICEIMTILVAYQVIGAPNFKHFYKEILWQYHKDAFPNLISYQHFIGIASIAVIPLID